MTSSSPPTSTKKKALYLLALLGALYLIFYLYTTSSHRPSFFVSLSEADAGMGKGESHASSAGSLPYTRPGAAKHTRPTTGPPPYTPSSPPATGQSQPPSTPTNVDENENPAPTREDDSASTTSTTTDSDSQQQQQQPEETLQEKWNREATERQTIFESAYITEHPDSHIRDDVLRDLYNDPVDYVILIKYVHCAVKLMVKNINKFQKPRYIWFVSAIKDHCKELVKMDDNIKCIWEDEVFPTFDSKKLSEMLHRKDLPARGRRGWYYLQMLNFGVARHLPPLADTYVVWDSDNVPMRADLTFFDYDKKQYKFYTQHNHYHKGLALGYHGTFEDLTGLKMIHPDPKFTVKNPTPTEDWRSETWVAHFMVWYKPYVREIMDHMEKHRGVAPTEWTLEVCRILQDDKQGKYIDSFADYDTYGSWMKQFHPKEVQALMGSYRKADRPKRTPNYKSGTCCVPERDYKEWQRRGWLNVVIEIHKGDEKACKTDKINMIGLRPGDKLLN